MSQEEQIDFEKAKDMYIKKLREDNIPFCIKCFDGHTNNLKKIDEINYICDDCLYIQKNFLAEIKNIS